jgi:hypothetical protein
MFSPNQGLHAAHGSRVIQIPLEWPAREGTVLELNSAEPSTSVLIGWDDGRQDWIKNEDIRPLRVWFISDEPIRELMPGPLEIHLARLMEPAPVLPMPSGFPKGPS